VGATGIEEEEEEEEEESQRTQKIRKGSIFCVVTLCSLFGGTYRFHVQD
jgi:hypothetical protein